MGRGCRLGPAYLEAPTPLVIGKFAEPSTKNGRSTGWFTKSTAVRAHGETPFSAIAATSFLRHGPSRVWCPPIRWQVATAWLPGIGADVMVPLALAEVAASPKAESGDQLLFLNK